MQRLEKSAWPLALFLFSLWPFYKAFSGLANGLIYTYGRGSHGWVSLQSEPFDFWFNFYCWLVAGSIFFALAYFAQKIDRPLQA